MPKIYRGIASSDWYCSVMKLLIYLFMKEKKCKYAFSIVIRIVGAISC